MRAMEAVRNDPLFYVRWHVQENFGQGIYRIELPRHLDWAACYLADEAVPGTSAHRRRQKEDDEMWALLSGDAKPKAAAKRTRGKK